MGLIKIPAIMATDDGCGQYTYLSDYDAYVTPEDVRAVSKVAVFFDEDEDEDTCEYPMLHFSYTNVIVDMKYSELQSLLFTDENAN